MFPKEFTEDIKTRWTQALSPGGSHAHRKGTYRLHNKDGTMCCLGVLADLYGAEWEDNGLSRCYKIKAGYGNIEFLEHGAFGLDRETQKDLAETNDRSNSFKAVIKKIEKIETKSKAG